VSFLEQRSLRRPSIWHRRQLIVVGGSGCSIRSDVIPPPLPARRQDAPMSGPCRETRTRRIHHWQKHAFTPVVGCWRRGGAPCDGALRRRAGAARPPGAAGATGRTLAQAAGRLARGALGLARGERIPLLRVDRALLRAASDTGGGARPCRSVAAESGASRRRLPTGNGGTAGAVPAASGAATASWP
jgi:hypothetical protein